MQLDINNRRVFGKFMDIWKIHKYLEIEHVPKHETGKKDITCIISLKYTLKDV